MDNRVGSGLESAFPYCRGNLARIAAQAKENHRGRVRMPWVSVSHWGNTWQVAVEIDALLKPCEQCGESGFSFAANTHVATQVR